MADTRTFDAILDWVRAGYPEGVPPKDYFPLLALLKRSLDEEQVTRAILTVFKEHGTDDPVTEDQIRGAIAKVIELEPNPEEINQVASRLASVGWPLSAPVN
ncbi:DUF3349 domain-containing protein [Williamsia maris]|uniref:DUF3349 domain-containing protein n=1 Tax=Williamsia maris TaxID=72806 RepID=A0ABT1HIU2_9NOCA|nr:DUF3349 domain-containing protein [Williamsia maris]MCP2177847.1 Protein of unknown function (DUF3349) [Williamsia maris]